METALIAAATIYFLAGFMLTLSASASFGTKLFFVSLHIVLCFIFVLIYRKITKKRKMRSSEYASKGEQKQPEYNKNAEDEKKEEQLILQKDRELYIKQKAADITSQIKAQRITIRYIGIHICFNDKKSRWETRTEYNTYRNAYDPWEYCGELTLNLTVKAITTAKEEHKNENTIKNAFSAAYGNKTEAFCLAKEINKYFNNTFDISENYGYRPCSDDSFAYFPVEISVILTK